MKYNIIQCADGNTTIVSTWENNRNGAKQAFHNTCKNLYADPNTVKAVVAILDEQLSIVDEQKEYINKSIPGLPFYTVTFNSHGGSSVEAQIIEEGNIITKPEDPVRDGYEFAGWELDGYVYNFDSPVNKDIVLVATWAEAQPTDPVSE